MNLLDEAFEREATPRGGSLGWLNVDAAPDISAAATRMIRGAGLALQPASLASFDRAFGAALCIIGAENWAAFGNLILNPLLGTDVRVRLLPARDITGDQVAAAEEVRRVFGDEVDEALDRFNALALPTLREAPLPLREAGDASRALATSSLVRPFNLSGHPALNIPFTLPSGLPAGLQLVGRKGADASLCALARCIAPLG